jgi:hypothetical protein
MDYDDLDVYLGTDVEEEKTVGGDKHFGKYCLKQWGPGDRIDFAAFGSRGSKVRLHLTIHHPPSASRHCIESAPHTCKLTPHIPE